MLPKTEVNFGIGQKKMQRAFGISQLRYLSEIILVIGRP